MHTQKIYGPPGTGKTHYLLQRFEEEVRAVKPNRLAFVTFTRAARLEALERTQMTEEELPYVKTLHAICYKLLRIRHEQLVQPKHLKAFAKRMGIKLSGYMPDVLSLDSLTEATWQQPSKEDRLLQLNHLGRHRGIRLREALRDAPAELDYNHAKWFTEAYRNWKTAEGLLDYTDLLTEFLAAGAPPELDVLFVDEAQDLSWLQWQVVAKLSQGTNRRYLAGDDDQAIFLWAGASADLFNTEPADEVKVLPQSHRIPHAVHRLSQQIISRVRVRQPKDFKPREVEGTFQEVGLLDAQWLEQGNTLCLFRNHHRGVVLGLQLEELGIPFKGQHSPLSAPHVRYAMAALPKIVSGVDLTVEEAQGLVELVPVGLLQPGARERTTGRATSFAVTSILNHEGLKRPWDQLLCRMRKLPYVQRVVQRYGMDAAIHPKVSLLSIHQSKGREADTVVLDLELARRTYEGYMQNPDDEHRVFYVAVTRARERLYALMPQDPMHYQL